MAEPLLRCQLQSGHTALLLARLGVYGMLAYSVAQRTSEIGVRLALGPRAGEIGMLIVRRGTLPVVSGLSLGLAAGLALSRLFQSMLFEVQPLDAATFFTVPALLAVAALGACLIPALRAARTLPTTALRYE